MSTARRTLIGSAIVPIRLVFLMWLVFFFDVMYGMGLSNFGLVPRHLWGLIGLFTAPMLHGSLTHLVSNTFPLLFLGSVLFYYYPRLANRVFLQAYFMTNVLVWLFSLREYNHIGASGLIYGLASFLIFYGLFRHDIRSLVISVVVMLLYGSLFYGVFPTNAWISWESHLAGALVGLVAAIRYR